MLKSKFYFKALKALLNLPTTSSRKFTFESIGNIIKFYRKPFVLIKSIPSCIIREMQAS